MKLTDSITAWYLAPDSVAKRFARLRNSRRFQRARRGAPNSELPRSALIRKHANCLRDIEGLLLEVERLRDDIWIPHWCNPGYDVRSDAQKATDRDRKKSLSLFVPKLEKRIRKLPVELRHSIFDDIAELDGRHVQAMLDAGADPNLMGITDEYPTPWFVTPLTLAVERGKKTLVELLLEHGADPSLRGNGYPDAPLHAAIFHKNAKIAERLLVGGARVRGVELKRASKEGASWLSMLTRHASRGVLRRFRDSNAHAPA